MTKFNNFFYFLQKKYLNTKKYINKCLFNNRLKAITFFKELQLFTKLFQLTKYLVEILFTGFVIKYSLDNYNVLSVGLLSAWLTYYIEWFVNLVKRDKDR